MSFIGQNSKYRPFLKWAGGKTQLLNTLVSFLPYSFNKQKEVTYIEPFIGGGAFLFFLLDNYPNLARIVINDINPNLIITYQAVKNNPLGLIESLKKIEHDYISLDDQEKQKKYYYEKRDMFNSDEISEIERASLMIFLNRTCFNGLYRENSKGHFNVPFGRYKKPKICDEQLLLNDSEALQKVEILCGDYSKTKDYINGYTFFYFDPPYRPLSATSNFNSYVKESFNDNEQIRLSHFMTELTNLGCYCLLSNSDSKVNNITDTFMEDLYSNYFIDHVEARRSINSNPNRRGNLTELLIRNYPYILD